MSLCIGVLAIVSEGCVRAAVTCISDGGVTAAQSSVDDRMQTLQLSIERNRESVAVETESIHVIARDSMIVARKAEQELGKKKETNLSTMGWIRTSALPTFEREN